MAACWTVGRLAALAVLAGAVPSLAAVEPASCAGGLGKEVDRELPSQDFVNLLQVGSGVSQRGQLHAAAVARATDASDAVRLAIRRLRRTVQNMADRVYAEARSLGVDCQEYPMFCSPELNCGSHPVTLAERASLLQHAATPAGHANPRSWCFGYPLYADSVETCILHNDLHGYAEATFQQQIELGFLEEDAAYCHVVGHCNNTEVNLNTTMAEAEVLCDAHFGNEHWTHIGLGEFMSMGPRLLAMEVNQSLTDADRVTITRDVYNIGAAVACAMGNYHCDVQYCREKYCSDPDYHARYSYLMPTA